LRRRRTTLSDKNEVALLKEREAAVAQAQRDDLVAQTVSEVQADVVLVHNIMTGVLKPNTHYGIIPGCPKPSLYLPGAEVLMKAFRLSVTVATQEIPLAGDHRKYISIARLTTRTGTLLCERSAECSTMEKK
jgi:hypothetical protein